MNQLLWTWIIIMNLKNILFYPKKNIIPQSVTYASNMNF